MHARNAPRLRRITAELRAFAPDSGGFHAADDRALVAALETISCSARGRTTSGARGGRGRPPIAGRVRAAEPCAARRATSTGAMLQSITRSSKRERPRSSPSGEWSPRSKLRPSSSACGTTTPTSRRSYHRPSPVVRAAGRRGGVGWVTVAVAEAIRSGLGEPGGDADAACLRAELEALLPLCVDVHADAARRAARQVRDRLDAAGVEARAAAQHEQQFWRVWVKPDGMVRGDSNSSPRAGMLVKAVFDQLTHPRLIEPQVRRGSAIRYAATSLRRRPRHPRAQRGRRAHAAPARRRESSTPRGC